MANTEGSDQNKSNNNALSTFFALSEVKNYYESSFKKLTTMFTIGMTFLVFVPIGGYLLVHSSLNETEKKLELRMNKAEERLKGQIVNLKTNLEEQISKQEDASVKIIKATEKKVMADIEEKISKQKNSSLKEIKATEKKVMTDIEEKISKQKDASVEVITEAEANFTTRIEDVKTEISEQQEDSLLEISKAIGLIEEKTKKQTNDIKNELKEDLAKAMAENYMRIADALNDLPTKQSYWKLISVVLYTEAALEYAKSGKQDDLRRILELSETIVATKLNGEKYKNDKGLRGVYRKLFSIILWNIYEIRSTIIEEKEHKKNYHLHLLDSLEEKTQNICVLIDKELLKRH